MAKPPKRVPGVRYGSSGFGAKQDEMNAVEDRRRARDAAIRKRTPAVEHSDPKESVLAGAVHSARNAYTKKAREAGARELESSRKTADLGRRLVDERYEKGMSKGGLVPKKTKPKPKHKY